MKIALGAILTLAVLQVIGVIDILIWFSATLFAGICCGWIDWRKHHGR